LEESAERSDEPGLEVPFNLDNLRHHLAQVSAFARVRYLKTSRPSSKNCQRSVNGVAVEKLNHQADPFEEII